MRAHQLGASVGPHVVSPFLFRSVPRINRFAFDAGANAPFQLRTARFSSRPCALPQAPAELQENVAESSAALVKVKFVLKKRCEFGQYFSVVGEDKALGAWIPESSIPMQWSEGHIWTTEVKVSSGKRVEYKLVLMGVEGLLDWQPGPNRVLELSAVSSPVVIEIPWVDDDACQERDLQSNAATHAKDTVTLSVAEDETINLEMSVDEVDGHALGSQVAFEETLQSEDLKERTNEDAEQQSMGSTSQGSEKNMAIESTVRRDLQWGREALSMLWSTFVQKDNGNGF
ncbi:hypothetical protein KP509_29G020900 [Ceratopteris richardii]|uniref:CBM20 domain-containing protein n=1 Tax=Ceratopteris richardii TaxID=49495 RepID=A0A8T2R6B2_CERRI|nr:hypothetical protein KP509_29G020900 [Ceratopteris richardii]